MHISKSTGILILNGENDSATPVQQAFLLQQRLTEVNHPDHTLITYPNLGHQFYASSQWQTSLGPIQIQHGLKLILDLLGLLLFCPHTTLPRPRSNLLLSKIISASYEPLKNFIRSVIAYSGIK
jgi:hypothetical protein